MVRHAWLVLLAALACHPTAAPPPVIGARPPPGPPTPPFATSARDGVVVRSLFDRADGVCGWQAHFHVEAIDIATGATRWKLPPPWTQVVAELPDGALVVSSEGPAASGPIQVAVVERASGTLRGTCDGPMTGTNLFMAWHVAGSGLVALTGRIQPPSGIEQERQPPEATLVLTTRADGCTLTPLDGALGTVTSLPPGTRDLTAGDVTIRDVPGDISADFMMPHTLVAERAGVTLWRRPLAAVPEIPCNLP